MNTKFLDIIKNRRSHYVLKNESTLLNEQIVSLVNEAVLYTPSAFNSQSSRVAILFGDEHNAFWRIVTDVLKKVVPADKFKPTQDKMNMFEAAYGTILFFEDQDVVEKLQRKFPLYKENFSIWSNQSAGMLNFVVWTALAENGLGASLQHYNPLINEAVIKKFNLPSNWELTAQMPFGVPGAPVDDKSFIPIEQRVKIFDK